MGPLTYYVAGLNEKLHSLAFEEAGSVPNIYLMEGTLSAFAQFTLRPLARR